MSQEAGHSGELAARVMASVPQPLHLALAVELSIANFDWNALESNGASEVGSCCLTSR